MEWRSPPTCMWAVIGLVLIAAMHTGCAGDFEMAGQDGGDSDDDSAGMPRLGAAQLPVLNTIDEVDH